LNIKVLNPLNVQHGVKELVINGIIISGNIVDFNMLESENDINVTMG